MFSFLLLLLLLEENRAIGYGSSGLQPCNLATTTFRNWNSANVRGVEKTLCSSRLLMPGKERNDRSMQRGSIHAMVYHECDVNLQQILQT